ncbi:hypothetical protein VTL71DRAFT_3034 [Oculimacula yallundae]|uniref:RING-type domain-containing protein n=1 Tax=Oculimacula yallundae TaxID=86028 RepID=A0ABR4C5Z7_9HELO
MSYQYSTILDDIYNLAINDGIVDHDEFVALNRRSLSVVERHNESPILLQYRTELHLWGLLYPGRPFPGQVPSPIQPAIGNSNHPMAQRIPDPPRGRTRRPAPEQRPVEPQGRQVDPRPRSPSPPRRASPPGVAFSLFGGPRPAAGDPAPPRRPSIPGVSMFGGPRPAAGDPAPPRRPSIPGVSMFGGPQPGAGEPTPRRRPSGQDDPSQIPRMFRDASSNIIPDSGDDWTALRRTLGTIHDSRWAPQATAVPVTAAPRQTWAEMVQEEAEAEAIANPPLASPPDTRAPLNRDLERIAAGPMVASAIPEREKCGICCEDMSDPAVFAPCGHRFDHQCIREMWNPQAYITLSPYTRVTCPGCRGYTTGLLHSFRQPIPGDDIVGEWDLLPLNRGRLPDPVPLLMRNRSPPRLTDEQQQRQDVALTISAARSREMIALAVARSREIEQAQRDRQAPVTRSPPRQPAPQAPVVRSPSPPTSG